jgi:hypothetical protein
MTKAHAEAELAALNAALLKVAATGGVVSYNVNGQSVSRDLRWATDRQARLMAFIARADNGVFSAVRFRNTN